MTGYTFPTSPAAYRVETFREVEGAIQSITITVRDSNLELWFSDAPDAIDDLIEGARAFARYAPDAMPSDEHLICCALEQNGITPDGYGADDDTAPGGTLLERLDRQHGLLSDLVGLTVDSETTAVIHDAGVAIAELIGALGTTLGLITKHNLAVALADGNALDFARLEAARATLAKWEG